MTFSEFLKILEKYYSTFTQSYFKKDATGTPKIADFVREVFRAATLDHKELFEDESLPQRLFSGNSKISKRLAKNVLSNLSKDDFIEFLSHLDSEDAITALAEDLGVTYSDVNELFIAIFKMFKSFLDDAANNKPLSRNDNEKTSAKLSPAFEQIDATKPILSASTFFGFHAPAKEFINREAPRQVFYDTLGGKSQQKVIMYYGIGGIGKSSLVKNLKEYTKEQGALFSSVDFDDPAFRSPYKALIELEKNLRIPLPHFDIAITLCFLKRNPETLSGDIGLPSEVSREAIKIYRVAGQSNGLTGVNGLIDQLYSSSAWRKILAPEMQTHLNLIEDMSANEIEEYLPIFFAYDLANHLAGNEIARCVLFFDTYELLWHNKHSDMDRFRCDEWIRKLAEKLGTVIFVLSGRERADWQLVDVFWENQISFVPLDLLDGKFAEQYLDICNITEPDIRKNIVDAAQGHPYYLDLCVDTYYKLKNAGNPYRRSNSARAMLRFKNDFSEA